MSEMINVEAKEIEIRSIDVITAEIWLYKQQAGAAILEIGHRLTEAKEQLSHGEWLPWLAEKVEFSEATAQRFMRLSKEYSNPSTVTDLGASKALALLALPAVERDEFISKKHEVDGTEKSVTEMSKRELEAAIKARDEAIKIATTAGDELAALKADIEAAENKAEEYALKLEQAKEKAAQEQEEQETQIAELQAQLLELENKEANTTNMPDKDLIEAAERRIKEELTAKIDKAQKAKEKAEQAKSKAQDDLKKLEAEQKESEDSARREKEALTQQIEALQKKLTVSSSSDMAVFKLHFEQCQTSVNKMLECVGKIRSAGDSENADKLNNALNSLLSATLAKTKEG